MSTWELMKSSSYQGRRRPHHGAYVKIVIKLKCIETTTTEKRSWVFMVRPHQNQPW